jgi:formamidopyrimidine-DNA glycosylase
MRRCVAAAAGSLISGVRRPPSKCQPITIRPPLELFRRQVVGRRIGAVGRIGKRIVLELDSGDRVVIEPRMTGLVLLADPPDREHLRIVLELSAGDKGTGTFFGRGGRKMSPSPRRLLFWDQRGLGVVQLFSAAEFAARYGPKRWGPDALAVSAAALRERLGPSRRPIKVALLDQQALAGIGNLYASEILHAAAVHPAEPCCGLRPRQWSRLHAEMRRVLQAAIRHQGSTLRDGTYRIARNKPGNYQLCHRVYQRTGQPCLRCGRAKIERIVQAQRSTFFCPRCQHRRGD